MSFYVNNRTEIETTVRCGCTKLFFTPLGIVYKTMAVKYRGFYFSSEWGKVCFMWVLSLKSSLKCLPGTGINTPLKKWFFNHLNPVNIICV